MSGIERPEGWRRGVVFVREIVPRRAIATLARRFYGEPYSAFPMSHSIERDRDQLQCRYVWRRNGREEFVSATASGSPAFVASGSLEEFITEHYWGYTGRRCQCGQYQVEHPPWRVWRAIDAQFEADVASLYGPGFVAPLSVAPISAFIAEGSPVVVRGRKQARFNSVGLRLARARRTAGSRRGGSNQSRSAYRSAVSPARSGLRDWPA